MSLEQQYNNRLVPVPSVVNRKYGAAVRRQKAMSKVKPFSRAIAFGRKTRNVPKLLELSRTRKFNSLADRAYANKRGYAIGTFGGDKVMFVSGSRDMWDWAANLAPLKYTATPVPAAMDAAFRFRTVRRLNRLAKREGVSVVVGHSRAGHLVSRMKGPFKKYAVDGAMILHPHRNKIINLYQGGKKGYVDNVLAIGGRNNYAVRTSKWHHPLRDPPHYVYRTKDPLIRSRY